MSNRLTVVTITYNRAHTLHRVFDSLMEQTYKDFVWLVVDDGSTDNTAEIMEEYKQRAWFDVEYVIKNHAGKYEGANLSYQLIKTPYFTNCDSDDSMCRNGLEILMKLWDEVPKDKYPKIWCVTARCKDSETGELVGTPFPKNVNDLSGKKQLKVLKNTTGEKQSCRRIDIVKNFPFPVYDDTTKLVPDTAWARIDAIYDQYCTNEIASVYYQNTGDSMAKSPSKERKAAIFHYCEMLINEYFDEFFVNPDVRTAFIHISRCGWRGGKTTNQILSAVKNPFKKLMVLVCMPISAFYNVFLDRHKRGSIG